MASKYDTENNRDVSKELPDDRYEAYTTDGDVVVYDAQNIEAWIESDAGMSLDSMH